MAAQQQSYFSDGSESEESDHASGSDSEGGGSSAGEELLLRHAPSNTEEERQRAMQALQDVRTLQEGLNTFKKITDTRSSAGSARGTVAVGGAQPDETESEEGDEEGSADSPAAYGGAPTTPRAPSASMKLPGEELSNAGPAQRRAQELERDVGQQEMARLGERWESQRAVLVAEMEEEQLRHRREAHEWGPMRLEDQRAAVQREILLIVAEVRSALAQTGLALIQQTEKLGEVRALQGGRSDDVAALQGEIVRLRKALLAAEERCKTQRFSAERAWQQVTRYQQEVQHERLLFEAGERALRSELQASQAAGAERAARVKEDMSVALRCREKEVSMLAEAEVAQARQEVHRLLARIAGEEAEAPAQAPPRHRRPSQNRMLDDSLAVRACWNGHAHAAALPSEDPAASRWSGLAGGSVEASATKHWEPAPPPPPAPPALAAPLGGSIRVELQRNAVRLHDLHAKLRGAMVAAPRRVGSA